ncbi:MAG: hypothetical protein ACM3MG_10615 [Bacillota bacterium]
MRKIVVSILALVTVLGFAAYAQIASIKQDMIAASRLAKQISSTVSDSSQNSQNAAYAGEMAQLFNDTMNQVPEVIRDFPSDQQQQAYSGYQQYIQYAVNLSLQLQQALQKNDNATAANLLQQLFQLEDEAHSHYNP